MADGQWNGLNSNRNLLETWKLAWNLALYYVVSKKLKIFYFLLILRSNNYNEYNITTKMQRKSS